MIRMFCDRCGREIERNAVSERIVREAYEQPGRIFGVEVIVAKNRVWNDGHLCVPCVVYIVTDGQDISAENTPKLGIDGANPSLTESRRLPESVEGERLPERRGCFRPALRCWCGHVEGGWACRSYHAMNPNVRLS